MSDDNPHSSSGPARSLFDKVGQWFQAEPQNIQQLVDVIQDANQRDLINDDTKEMIKGVLEVADLRVRDIMIPRSQIVTIEVSDSIETFLPLIIKAGHSRFPVINEDKDHIEGILLAKDLLQYAVGDNHPDVSLAEIIRPAVVIPESKKIDKLLKEFRSERYHMAIVVDEFGGVSGLVTIEDILEQIVGDIEDEFAREENLRDNIRRINSTTYMVDALTDIEIINDHFGSNFSDEEVDTLGGLVSHAFGHLPTRGEKINLDGYQFKISNADKRRILQVQVTVPELHRSTAIED
jgi:magnesium and cobalt transporter